jgi:penicillin amidase
VNKLRVVLVSLAAAVQLVAAQSPSDRRAAGLMARRATASLSQTSGTIALEGLKKPVEVIRDRWGVPHIYAETTEDLFFAQGFVAAQDRLWQMELWRRTGEGKLAEILGPSAVQRDKFARLLRYRGDMTAEWTSYAPDAKAIIESFARGVNACITNAGERLPIEFLLTGIRPEPWTPEVCLTRMAGYVMTSNASRELLRAQLVNLIGAEKTSELLETDPPRKLEVPQGLDLKGIDEKILREAAAASARVSFGQSEGSNNWVVDGSMSATGKPLLANDPHRPIMLPSLRYMVHLIGPGWNVIGAGEPTLPGVAAGHNERVGFGFTIVGIDQQDIYVEETNPADPTQYRYDNKWVGMKIEREQIRVKGGEPVAVELRFTRHGPVIYEDAALHRAYVLRWVGMEPGSAGYLASLSLNRATDWKSFLKSAEKWAVPSENLVYADVDGNIGWQAAGRAPRRRGWSGLLPVPGAAGKYEWDGYLPLSELPRAYNPSKHFIATANHKIIPEGYRREINFDWSAPFRFRRIDEVLSKGQKFTVADFERLQHDELSIPARELVPLLRGVTIEDQRAAQARDLLLNWDFVLSKDSAAAAVFEIWLTKLDSILKPSVPAAAWELIRARMPLSRILRELKNPGSNVFGADPKTKRDSELARTLTEAIADLGKLLGDDMSRWRWGDLHRAEFKHQLSTDDARRAAFDLKSVPRGGDGNTVNATGGGSRGFTQRAGASFRQILDLSDWDKSVAINVPGQSGQPQSRHYGDLLPLWADGKYFPMLFSRAKIEQFAASRLTLTPRQPAAGSK